MRHARARCIALAAHSPECRAAQVDRVSVAPGCARDDGDKHRDWLVGNFIEFADSVANSRDVEIKWGVHEAGGETRRVDERRDPNFVHGPGVLHGQERPTAAGRLPQDWVSGGNTGYGFNSRFAAAEVSSAPSAHNHESALDAPGVFASLVRPVSVLAERPG